jgi:hypothetical protein
MQSSLMRASGARARKCVAASIVGLAFVGAGCSRAGTSSTSGSHGRDADECVDEDVDVASEPPLWRQDTFREWFRDGCLVRIDVITDRPGPDHCGWDGTRVIAVGNPVGERFTSEADTVQFVRDPVNAYRAGLDQGFEARTTLPATARFSGYRSASEELWLVPGDTQFIWIVSGQKVERWPAGAPPLCA